MKILLVRPQTPLKVAQRLEAFLHLEPLALEIVAGGIPRHHEIRILDLASISGPDRIYRQVLAEFRPDLVGFTAYSNQAAVVKQQAALAKRLHPAAFILAGGIHATLVPEDLRLPGVIDLVVRGEGGVAMRTLFPILERRASLPESTVFLPTASSRFGELAAMPPPELPPFDQTPAPRRDLVDRSRYFCIWPGEPGQRLTTLFPQVAVVRTSVGCPKRCSFCVVHYLANGKYVRQTPEQAVEEIASVAEDHVYFVDDEMFIDAPRATRMVQLLQERGIRKHYSSWTRADTIVKHPEMFRLWKQAGLALVSVGVESMDPDTLQDYQKGVNPDINRQAVEILRGMGIGLHASLMINPEFTPAEFAKVLQTVAFLAPAEVSFTVYSPPPGTDQWKNHQDRFICPDPYAFYDGMHTLLPTQLPLKEFYAQFSRLLAQAARYNPWRLNKVKVPWRDWVRFWFNGFRYGMRVQLMYLDYSREAFKH